MRRAYVDTNSDFGFMLRMLFAIYVVFMAAAYLL